MEIQNNLENKSIFFAQYWGQRVVRHLGLGLEEHTFLVNENILCKYDITEYYIRLTPLSSITDDDAIEVAKFEGSFDDAIIRGNYLINNILVVDDYNSDTHLVIKIVDYLRSKGYALPYMGLSVEKLIEYGWIKLKTS